MTIPRGWRTWLRPGMHVKRWAALFLLGTVLTGLSIAMGLVYSYRYTPFPEPLSTVIQASPCNSCPASCALSSSSPPAWRSCGYGFYRLSRGLILPVLAHTQGRTRTSSRSSPSTGSAVPAGDQRRRHRRRHRTVEPAARPQAARPRPHGHRHRRRRRRQHRQDPQRIRHPAPGDIRNCLIALADDESLVSQLFQYRFNQAGSELDGHSFGNLFITALTKVTGSFERAVIESANVLNIRGRVLPSTLENVASMPSWSTARSSRANRTSSTSARRSNGSSGAGRSGGYQPAVAAILNADLIVLGPGSLYTSVVPNLLVPDIVRAVRIASAPKVYVMNVATQEGETDHFAAVDHVHVVIEQLGPGVLDAVLINSNRPRPRPSAPTSRSTRCCPRRSMDSPRITRHPATWSASTIRCVTIRRNWRGRCSS